MGWCTENHTNFWGPKTMTRQAKIQRSRKSQLTRTLRVEALAARKLMAADIDLSGGILEIEGTNDHETIEISYEYDQDWYVYAHPCPGEDCTVRILYQVDAGPVDETPDDPTDDRYGTNKVLLWSQHARNLGDESYGLVKDDGKPIFYCDAVSLVEARGAADPVAG